MVKNNNTKFLEYLQVCGKEDMYGINIEDLRDTPCDFREYYEFMSGNGFEFDELVDGFNELTERLKDNVNDYNTILKTSIHMDEVHKHFINPKGDYEASRRLSCIMDEANIDTKNLTKNWKGLAKIYVGPSKIKINSRFYKTYIHTVGDDNDEYDIRVLRCNQEKLKGINIGMIVYKDGENLTYKADNIDDMAKIGYILKKLKFEYDLVVLAPFFTDIFDELERYLLGKMTKKDFDDIIRDGA